jgi:hypothetical protein
MLEFTLSAATSKSFLRLLITLRQLIPIEPVEPSTKTFFIGVKNTEKQLKIKL